MTGFTLAEPDIPCMDRWPAGTFTKNKEAAYRREQDAGNIAGLTIERRNGIAIARYLSCIPQDWMLRQLADGLRKDAEQITIGGLV